jgi:hypothetical protein
VAEWVNAKMIQVAQSIIVKVAPTGSIPVLTTNKQNIMKIKTIHKKDEENWGQYAGVETILTTEEGETSVNFAGGEPEDMTISRDLSDAWSITNLLIMAYNAGKNNEILEIESIEID